MITGKTKLLGVIGNPITHSLSPVMHNAAIAALQVDYIYIPLPVKNEDLATALAGFQAINLVGFNITIPHKQAILSFLTEVSQVAQTVGAVNTVWRTDNGWSGTNTDVAGFIAPLQNMSTDWTKVTPVILGNGGAARAVVYGLWQLGCPKIRVLGRYWENLVKFKQSWSNSPIQPILEIHSLSELTELVSTTELLVNTTPIGMYPQGEESPLDEETAAKIKPGTVAYDLIYTPSPTKFLQQAQERGAIAIDGLEMLINQGCAALEIWLQQSVPVEIMRQALKNYLLDKT